MRCAVGQEFDAENDNCSGEATRITYSQAAAFAKKIGKGWRVPSIAELETISSDGLILTSLHTRTIIVSGKRKYTSFGSFDSCNETSAYWTATGVTDDANQVFILRCKAGTQDQPMRRETVNKMDGNALALIFVKSGK